MLEKRREARRKTPSKIGSRPEIVYSHPATPPAVRLWDQFPIAKFSTKWHTFTVAFHMTLSVLLFLDSTGRRFRAKVECE
jgi:hypothetical protein